MNRSVETGRVTDIVRGIKATNSAAILSPKSETIVEESVVTLKLRPGFASLADFSRRMCGNPEGRSSPPRRKDTAPPVKPAKDILAQVELELTAQQMHAIRTRAVCHRCSDEEYVRRLISAAMLQNVLMTGIEVPKED